MEDRALYIICEGISDAEILRIILDSSKFNKVYAIPAGGYSNLSSLARTIRLMKNGRDSTDKIVVVFDSDSLEQTIIEEKMATMLYMTNAQIDPRLGVFCFVPNIDIVLFNENGFACNAIKEKTIRKELESRMEDLKNKPIIKEIQAFLDK